MKIPSIIRTIFFLFLVLSIFPAFIFFYYISVDFYGQKNPATEEEIKNLRERAANGDKEADEKLKQALGMTGKMYSMCPEFLLTEDEVNELTEKAEKGNTSSARKLALYYEGCSTPSKEKQKYWLEFAAKRGDVDAQSDLVSFLRRQSNFSEALYWARILHDNGSKSVQETIETLEHLQTQQQFILTAVAALSDTRRAVEADLIEYGEVKAPSDKKLAVLYADPQKTVPLSHGDFDIYPSGTILLSAGEGKNGTHVVLEPRQTGNDAITWTCLAFPREIAPESCPLPETPRRPENGYERGLDDLLRAHRYDKALAQARQWRNAEGGLEVQDRLEEIARLAREQRFAVTAIVALAETQTAVESALLKDGKVRHPERLKPRVLYADPEHKIELRYGSLAIAGDGTLTINASSSPTRAVLRPRDIGYGAFLWTCEILPEEISPWGASMTYLNDESPVVQCSRANGFFEPD